MKTPKEVAELFNDSLDRCKRDKQFIEKFYQRFFASDPSVPVFFAKSDMKRQVEMLGASLHMVMLASQDPLGSEPWMHQTAETHHKRNIPNYLYDTWLDCLVATVAQVDPKFSHSVDEAWRVTMWIGIDYLKSYGK